MWAESFLQQPQLPMQIHFFKDFVVELELTKRKELPSSEPASGVK